jgi:hypothetical protein
MGRCALRASSRTLDKSRRPVHRLAHARHRNDPGSLLLHLLHFTIMRNYGSGTVKCTGVAIPNAGRAGKVEAGHARRALSTPVT